ncbi:MAG: glycosyltransferase [Pseudomonadota bacterium]
MNDVSAEHARPRVAFLVTSLSGSGHLVRTLALADAVAETRAETGAENGARTLVLSGGRPLGDLAAPAVPLVQLPPLLVAGRDFSRPTDAAGRPADADLMAARRAAIQAALETFAPDVLVAETWPLGRRRLTDEFLEAIATARAARPSAKVLTSVRDIPEPPSRPDRITTAATHLADHVDAVLCHGDQDVLPLHTTWPLPADGPPIRYTGYVATKATPAPAAGSRDEVLVAVGGGDIGAALLDLAARAALLSARPWRLRVGGPAAAARALALSAQYPAPNLTIEPAGADYRARLARAAVSVSLAGYNTVTDLAPLDTPALLVPDETAGEREQAIRADALARSPGIVVSRLEALTERGLSELAEAMAKGPRRPPLPLSLDGAARAAEIILTNAGRS